MLAIESVERIEPEAITTPTRARAGFPDARGVLAALRPDGELYRIAFHLAGPDPRIALRERAALDADERTAIAARLARFDARRPRTVRGRRRRSRPSPRIRVVRAADLAAALGRERLPFKADVRKLKALGAHGEPARSAIGSRRAARRSSRARERSRDRRRHRSSASSRSAARSHASGVGTSASRR